jgi:hypothetical protein
MGSSTWDGHGLASTDIKHPQQFSLVPAGCGSFQMPHCCCVAHLVLTTPGAALRAGTQATAKEVKA